MANTSRYVKREEMPNIKNLIKRYAVHSLFTSTGEVGTTSSSLVTLRSLLIPANSFKPGEHIHFEGGGFFLGTGGNVTAARIVVQMGGVTMFDNTFNPGSPGAHHWFLHGVVTQNSDIGGVLYFSANTPVITRGELLSWPGPTANMNLELKLSVTVSAGTGAAQSETWNVIKYPPGI